MERYFYQGVMNMLMETVFAVVILWIGAGVFSIAVLMRYYRLELAKEEFPLRVWVFIGLLGLGIYGLWNLVGDIKEGRTWREIS